MDFQPQNFTGFVLAGGRSSRMGTDKSQLSIGGETFLSRAARALRPVCARAAIVLDRARTIETALEIVRDVYPERGALGGLHAAFRSCRTERALVLAVDLPFVTTGALVKLASIAAANADRSAVVPRQRDGRPQPLCAVYRAAECLPAIEKLIGENTLSLRALLERIDHLTVAENELDRDERLFFNVNRPSDFAAVEENPGRS